MTKVAVIMPAFNAALTLPVSIDSVLGQKERISLIVVNDGSTDQTLRVLSRYEGNIKVIDQRNAGPAAARNTGIQALGNEDYVGFLDADDRWPDQALATQLTVFNNEPQADVVFGCTTGFAGHPALTRTPRLIWTQQRFLQLGSILFRRAAIDNAGLFEEDHRYAEDMSLMLRIRDLGLQVVEHDNVVLEHFRHENNMTKDVSAMNRDFLKLLKKRMDAKR